MIIKNCKYRKQTKHDECLTLSKNPLDIILSLFRIRMLYFDDWIKKNNIFLTAKIWMANQKVTRAYVLHTLLLKKDLRVLFKLVEYGTCGLMLFWRTQSAPFFP